MDEFHGHFQFVCDAGEVRTVNSFCFSVGLFGDEKSCRVLVSLAFLEVVNPGIGCRHVVVMCGMSEFMPEGGACVVERHSCLQDDDSRFRIPAATFLAWQVPSTIAMPLAPARSSSSFNYASQPWSSSGRGSELVFAA